MLLVVVLHPLPCCFLLAANLSPRGNHSRLCIFCQTNSRSKLFHPLRENNFLLLFICATELATQQVSFCAGVFRGDSAPSTLSVGVLAGWCWCSHAVTTGKPGFWCQRHPTPPASRWLQSWMRSKVSTNTSATTAFFEALAISDGAAVEILRKAVTPGNRPLSPRAQELTGAGDWGTQLLSLSDGPGS